MEPMPPKPPKASSSKTKNTVELLSPKKAASIAAVVAAVLTVVLFSDLGGLLETTLARPLEFQTRRLLGFDPQLAPSIKVFAFEDRSASALHATDLALDDWTRVLKAIAARQPKAILIDKTFSHTPGAEHASAFVDEAKKLGVPVIAKAHVTGVELKYLDLLPTDRYGLDYGDLIRTSAARHGLHARRPHWLPERQLFPYGPLRNLQDAFARIGHNASLDGGYLRPLVSVGNERGLLHWSLLATGEQTIEDGVLTVGGREVPVDESGRLPVNLVPFERCLERTRSLYSALELERKGQPLDSVSAGDVVVILPDMFTGTIDFEDTAIGRLPVGFISLAAINSAITGDWLGLVGGYTPLTWLLCFCGAFLARRLSRPGFVTFATAIALALAAVGVLAFALASVIVPWLVPAFGFALAAAIGNFEAMRTFERRAGLLRHDLDGMLHPAKLQKIIDRKALHRLEATEQVVTIMFIDIVGFSRAAEKQTPKEAFSSLKSLVDALRQVVHDFGGDVDRTMGDGMLCVFGYDFDDRAQAPRHADQAVQCAARIQQENIQRILKAQKTQQSVFPLRIGINTTGVYLGNLGDSEKVDFTVIGNGVNFAQRLETACDRHMVMIGASTRDLLGDFDGKDEMLRRRYIRVKHHEELVEAWELDPFYNDNQTLNDGDEAYRQFIGVERSDTRWPVPYPGLIKVATDHGDGELINFSNDGFTIKLPLYYAKDVTINMRLDSIDGYLGDRLERAGLLPIVLEVRWARPSGEGYIHGCLIKNMTSEHREDIINMLRDSLHRYVAEARSA
jgi:class 3 adenylate cyclase